ncbi:MAG: protein kinase, partial [Nannocystaceae bacterium]|nr:protein kinase [Nannocystaceae bacterium]
MDERATGTPSSSAVHTQVDDGVVSDATAELEPGAHVERYIVLHTLGHGAMGTVYAALDPMLDRRVALKLLRVGASRDPERAEARLLAEAQAMAQVSSANVVVVHDVGLVEGGVFVAMELIDGVTLREHVHRHAPSWRSVIGLLLQAAAGLAAVHRAGLVHRDVKPDNVMVGVDGRVRLMDLGIAQRVGA